MKSTRENVGREIEKLEKHCANALISRPARIQSIIWFSIDIITYISLLSKAASGYQLTDFLVDCLNYFQS